MILKIVISSILALSTVSAVAGNMYIYKDKAGEVLLTNVNPSGNSDKYSKKVKVTYIKADEPTTKYNTRQDTAQSSNYTKNVADTSSVQSGTEFEVPYEYRLPTKSDVVGDWKRFNAPNHLKADFNGDGIEDEAYILPKKGSKGGYGVFVSINKPKAGKQTGRKSQMFRLTDSNDMSPQSFAIELAEPSNEIWESACGKG